MLLDINLSQLQICSSQIASNAAGTTLYPGINCVLRDQTNVENVKCYSHTLFSFYFDIQHIENIFLKTY
jgi:hypothetical protein